MGTEPTRELLNESWLSLLADKGLENRQDVAAVLDHAIEDVTQTRLALRLAVPAGQDCGGNLDVAAQLLGGVTTQEKAVKERRLALRVVVFLDTFDRAEFDEQCSHKKVQFTGMRSCVKWS